MIPWCSGEQQAPGGVVRVRRPDLGAVDQPAAVHLRGGGPQTGQVGSGAGLAEALTPVLLAAQDAGQVPGLLLVGAVRDDGRSGEHHADPVERVRRPAYRGLLVEDGLCQRVQSPAAVRDRPRQPGPVAGAEPVLPHPRPVLALVLRQLLLVGDVAQRLVQPGADLAPERQVGRAVIEVHPSLPSCRTVRSRRHLAGSSQPGLVELAVRIAGQRVAHQVGDRALRLGQSVGEVAA